jgi:hypothetical protein
MGNEPVSPEQLMRREELREYLSGLGYPLTRGTFAQLCSPARGEGPRVWGLLGPQSRLSCVGRTRMGEGSGAAAEVQHPSAEG